MASYVIAENDIFFSVAYWACIITHTLYTGTADVAELTRVPILAAPISVPVPGTSTR